MSEGLDKPCLAVEVVIDDFLDLLHFVRRVKFFLQHGRLSFLRFHEFLHLYHQLGLVVLEDSDLSEIVLCEVYTTDECDRTSHRLYDVGKLLVVELPPLCVVSSTLLPAWLSDLLSQMVDLSLHPGNDLIDILDQPFSWVCFLFEHLPAHLDHICLSLVWFVRYLLTLFHLSV